MRSEVADVKGIVKNIRKCFSPLKRGGAVFVGVVFFCQGSSAELLYQFDVFKVALNFLHGAFLKPCKKVNLTF